MTNGALKELSGRGVSLYLDDISRSRLDSGDLRRLIDDRHVVGVTTNPSIFKKALDDGEGYDSTVGMLARSDFSTADALRVLTCMDVRDAADLLAPIHRATSGHDGWVSLEVNPFYADDTDATVAEASLLHWMVGRQNVMMKVPATDAGLLAVTELVSRGIPVNVTVIFSLDRYRQAAEAYVAGLERAQEQGRDLTAIRSVASFYLARLDDAVDQELDSVDTPEAAALRGRIALSHAHLAQDAHSELHTGGRWEAIARDHPGVGAQRLLWASTSTKDDQYSDTRYVTNLALPGSINTMPEETLLAVDDHGAVPGEPLGADVSDARAALRDLDALGISFEETASRLEREAVTGFESAWREIQKVLRSRMESVRERNE
ncbi:transaldolase [Streptomyces cyaneofuscatus]|uniref:transaldolase n=1 Tax=Streptomyces cyaneofuscatus TaxID=66883 RepID=UPI0029553A2D|nr:transaldolase [Streptomyces cyaneofuscatus]WOP09858.1 transaldolase [Streptomyces cyaneofuscatus]